ncbi:MAG: ABC transporter permease subunit [Planctomycetes bacterium]|nr:ABC transporter permease subunit [Planctomycetota bacterium]
MIAGRRKLSFARAMPSFPLLGKELLEIASRRRTYVIRVVLALLLLVAFAIAYQQELGDGDPLFDMIGKGGFLCLRLFECLFIGVCVFMPAMTAGVITVEKEQGSLVLLLLTPMSPFGLVLQKCLGRVLSTMAILMLALPLFSIAYAYGGLDVETLFLFIYVLILTCLQLAALSIAVSAWCRTSTGAFCLTYILEAVLYMGPYLMEQLSYSFYQSSSGGIHFWKLASGIFPLQAFRQQFGRTLSFDLDFVCDVLTTSLPALLSIPVFLLLARLFIVRRADLSGSNPFLRLFRFLDATFQRLDARIGRTSSLELPLMNPVAWRELNRRSLSNWRYLVRLFVPVYSVAILAMVLFSVNVDREWADTLQSMAYYAVLASGTLALMALGAGLIAGERTHQTLDVLLTTPISPRQILTQKASALRRIQGALLALVLLTIWFDYYMGHMDATRCLVRAAAAVVFLPCFTWIAIICGIVSPRRNQAMIAVVIISMIWLAGVPLLLSGLESIFGDHRNYYYYNDYYGREETFFHALQASSPVGLLLMNDDHEFRVAWGMELGVPFVALSGYLVLWMCLRATARDLAGRFLRRSVSHG